MVPIAPTRLTSGVTRPAAPQMLLPGVGRPGQERLRAASVLVVGAGGLGCPVALYLAAGGVGRLTVVDDDDVELGNLHRQVTRCRHAAVVSPSSRWDPCPPPATAIVHTAPT